MTFLKSIKLSLAQGAFQLILCILSFMQASFLKNAVLSLSIIFFSYPFL